MSNEITLIKGENEDLKLIIESGKEKMKVCIEYHTDEKELEKELIRNIFQ